MSGADETTAAAEAGDDHNEFAQLPARRRQARPIPSAVILGLSLVMLWHLRGDLRYALSRRRHRAISATPPPSTRLCL